jgi:drug/metabolite transporter (DMT)-like permease
VRKNHLDALAIGLMVICCAAWALQQILIKITVAEIAPLWQAGIRFAGSSLLLLIWCRSRGVRVFERDGSLWPGLLAGFLFCLEFICIYLGMRDTTASRLTLFLYCAPFVLALLLPRFVPQERVRPLQWLGLALAFGALALAFGDTLVAPGSDRQWVGDLLALCSGVFWGLTTLVIRVTVLSRISAEKMLLYQIGITAVAMLAVSLWIGESWSLGESPLIWMSLAYQTLIGSFVTLLMWMWMLQRYPATGLSAFSFLTPMLAMVFSVLLLGEPLTVALVIALVGVSAGIVLVNRR